MLTIAQFCAQIREAVDLVELRLPNTPVHRDEVVAEDRSCPAGDRARGALSGIILVDPDSSLE